MTKNELSEMAGVSLSFISDLTNGKANPSLKTMEAIAKALETSLPLLLESTDLKTKDLEMLIEGKFNKSLPTGFVRITAVLPEHKAFVVKQWDEKVRQFLREKEDEGN